MARTRRWTPATLALAALALAPFPATGAPTWVGMPRNRDNGLATCRRVLRSFQSSAPGSKSAGVRRCVVFDIDNTLVDTRGRTRAAARSYAWRHPLSGLSLARVPFSAVGYNATQTADKLGLKDRTSERFHRHWFNFFWRPRNFRHDGRIEKTIALAKEAGDAKIEVFYLTGRINRLKPGTIKQLKKLGLPNVDEAHVICKPGVNVPTGPFKRRVVTRMQRQRYQIGWFMSDSRSDIAAVQKVLAPGTCVLVGFPVGPGHQPPVHPRTPILRVGK